MIGNVTGLSVQTALMKIQWCVSPIDALPKSCQPFPVAVFFCQHRSARQGRCTRQMYRVSRRRTYIGRYVQYDWLGRLRSFPNVILEDTGDICKRDIQLIGRKGILDKTNHFVRLGVSESHGFLQYKKVAMCRPHRIEAKREMRWRLYKTGWNF